MSIDTVFAAVERRALAYGLVMYELGRQGLESGGVEQQKAAEDLHNRIIAQMAMLGIEEHQRYTDDRVRDVARMAELTAVRDAANDRPDNAQPGRVR